MNVGNPLSVPHRARFKGCARFRHLMPTVLLVLVVLALNWSGARAGGETISARLQITNAKAEDMVRCQLVFAHFVTLEADRIGPDQRATFDLQRDIRGGALFYLHEGNRPMALENILCGLDEDWVATRNDLDLRDLRGGKQDRLVIICGGGEGLSCAPRSASAALDE